MPARTRNCTDTPALVKGTTMQKIIQTLVDDIDGSEATGTLTFSVAGVDYTIDLNDKNTAKFEKAIAPFVAHAQRVGGRRQRGATVTKLPSNAKTVRSWAQANGYAVPDRGRIPGEILAAYEAAEAS
jgi:hypothetical protein